MHPARIMIMIEIIFSLIKVGSVRQEKIAQGTSIKVKTNSITRRIQRFFEQQVLCPKMASKLIFSFFDWTEKIILTLDRTNWKFGKTDINFLVVCAIYRDYSIPLCWILLPHQGNSHTKQRIDLIEMLSAILPLNCIESLLADREFVGAEWFKYLFINNIPFCIRIKENMLIRGKRCDDKIQLKKIFQSLEFGKIREVRQLISDVPLRILATRIETGELLILATYGHEIETEAEIFSLYSLRWSIETMFKSLKSSGFNFEDTHQKNLERLHKMMILLAIAYAWSIKIGEIKHAIKPIKIKANGRPEFSLFTYGFRVIKTILLKGVVKLIDKLLTLLENIALNQDASPDLKMITVVY